MAWILDYAGLNPGFLIGGVAKNFGASARLTDSEFFVIEADEYDSAFFDKRSKFVHYRPSVLLINNLEFDHADIFIDLKVFNVNFIMGCARSLRMAKSFSRGMCPLFKSSSRKGCWAATETFDLSQSAMASARGCKLTAVNFPFIIKGFQLQGSASWALLGLHNLHNALAAILCALEKPMFL